MITLVKVTINSMTEYIYEKLRYKGSCIKHVPLQLHTKDNPNAQ